VLEAFAGQLATALEQRRLRAKAAEAETRAEADQLRTAILRAVSHDLRTPLASIKASSTSLLADDIAWSATQQRDFVETIDEEADRLDRLVGNLLDMSRIESGAVAVASRSVGLEEVVGLALASLGEPSDRVEVVVPVELPPVLADTALLERVIANLVRNALLHGPSAHDVRVEGAVVGEKGVLRVVDRGPGIPPDQRELVLGPFQRLGDGSSTIGVGLGLAVAKGFVEAMDGRLELDDTPGGGLTVTVALPLAPTPTSPVDATPSGTTPAAARP
jgi:two-component system sensor histidine kinase KdpD